MGIITRYQIGPFALAQALREVEWTLPGGRCIEEGRQGHVSAGGIGWDGAGWVLCQGSGEEVGEKGRALIRAEEYTVILLYFFCFFLSFRLSYVSLISYSLFFFLLYFQGVGRGRRPMVWGGIWESCRGVG